MKRDLYISIIRCICGEEFDLECTLSKLKDNFPGVRAETLRSILTQQYSSTVKKTYRSQTSELKRKEYCDSFENSLNISTLNENNSRSGCTIIDIAKKNRFSPALTAKIILSEHLGQNGNDSDSKKHVKELLKDTNLIPNGKLAFEVWRACLEDENCGYYSDCIKSAVGNEYEKRLKQNLRRLGISFQDEHDLRNSGYDKTPDVVLDVPFATKDGAIINWIESKALFGSDENHVNYLKDQLRCYWNRFGTGLVIYWFGFISDLRISSLTEGIWIDEAFPEDDQIILMNPAHDICD